jgi:O-antigen/teichoic acid export membrane protein
LKRLGYTVLKNALANVIRLGIGAVVALVLPRTLTRVLDRDHFAAWALLLQIAAYASFLDFGVQTAVARFVAQAMQRGDEKERDGYTSTAIFLLICAAALGFCVVCAMAWLLPYMFKQAPLHLLSELREGLILLAAFSALTLPTAAFTGVFIGLHKNEYPTLTSGLSRLIGAGLVIMAVHRTHSLVVMAGLVGGMNLVGGVLQYVEARRILPTMLISLQSISKDYLRTLTQFCAGLGVMSFSMFLVGGLDLTIVGYFRFSGVAYYSVASNLVLLLSGLASAGSSALIAPVAEIHARGEYKRLGGIVMRATRHVTQVGVIFSFLSFLLGRRILTLWVGPLYAHGSISILNVLVVATAIRMLGGPYTVALIGAGKQSRALYSPIFEGIINLGVSLFAGYYLGPIGVAIGTLVGAISAIGLQVLYNMPRIPEVRIEGQDFMLRAVIQPTFELSLAFAGFFFAVSGLLHGALLRLLSVTIGITLTGLLYKRSMPRRLSDINEIVASS